MKAAFWYVVVFVVCFANFFSWALVHVGTRQRRSNILEFRKNRAV